MEVKLLLGCPTVNLRIWWLRVRPAPGPPLGMNSIDEIKIIRLLLARLERVSVDSYWAHRASGIRGALLETLDHLEKGTATGQANVPLLISSAFQILTRAAREKR
jgi:hypothetical protein